VHCRTAGHERSYLPEKLQPFSAHAGILDSEAGQVASRLGEVRNETLSDGVGYRDEYNGNLARRHARYAQ
jgi:hypothetical protein